MLRRILAISGRPGLFRLVSQGKNMLIVEDLATGRRTPAHQRDKVSSLADISMYTLDEDAMLSDVLNSLYKVLDGKSVDLKEMKADGELRELFAKALPNYDEERVRLSDIRKLLSWYNILVAAGFTDFSVKEEEEDAPAEESAE